MFQEVFSESHVCRLGTREDFKKKQFHFDAPWSEIIGKSGIEDIHGLCESQKEKIAMDCCTLVRRSPSFYREDIFSMDILMGFTHTSDKKDEILKCIEAQHLKPESKKFLKNALYKIANINKYRDYCNEHNYRIFIDKLWKDYEASKYKNTDEALFIEKL